MTGDDWEGDELRMGKVCKGAIDVDRRLGNSGAMSCTGRLCLYTFSPSWSPFILDPAMINTFLPVSVLCCDQLDLKQASSNVPETRYPL